MAGLVVDMAGLVADMAGLVVGLVLAQRLSHEEVVVILREAYLV
jgi:hypothetical protein